MRPFLLQIFFAVVGLSPATAARVALSSQLRGQAHSLSLRLSNLEQEVRRQSRRHAGRNGVQKVHAQWDEAEEEMLKLRRQVESTEEEARKSVEVPEDNSDEVTSVQAESEGATKGELRAVEAKLEGQQAQIDHLESLVNRLASSASLSSKAQNTSQASTPQDMSPPDMEAASQEAADNLAKEMGTDQGEGGLLTEDEVEQEDKDYHTPAPHVAASVSRDEVQPPEESAQMGEPAQPDPARLDGSNENTWQDFVDPGEDADEADGLEEEDVPVKDVLNMARGDLQPLAPAEIREVDIPRSHSQRAELESSDETHAENANDVVDAESVGNDAEKLSSSESAGLVPLDKVEEETAQVEQQDSGDASLPAFDNIDEEDTTRDTNEISMAESKEGANARSGSLENAEQLLKDDGSADAMSPAEMGHLLAGTPREIPGAVAFAAPKQQKHTRKQHSIVRPAGSPMPLFFGPPPNGVPVSAPA